MEDQLKAVLIKEAKTRLIESPKDAAHDITHHERTWEMAKQIVKHEELEVDMDVLEIVCWWHDVVLDGAVDTQESRVAKQTAEYLKNKLQDYPDIAEEVFDSVANHEFGSTPNFITGKILQDADKLEVLSEVRLRNVLDAINKGEHPKESFIAATRMVRDEWFPKLRGNYHFDFSNKYHKEHEPSYEEIEEYIKRLESN